MVNREFKAQTGVLLGIPVVTVADSRYRMNCCLCMFYESGSCRVSYKQEEGSGFIPCTDGEHYYQPTEPVKVSSSVPDDSKLYTKEDMRELREATLESVALLIRQKLVANPKTTYHKEYNKLIHKEAEEVRAMK